MGWENIPPLVKGVKSPQLPFDKGGLLGAIDLLLIRNGVSTVNNVLKKWCALLIIIASLFVTGCASTTTFSSYPRKIKPLLTSMSGGEPLDLSQSLTSERKSNDKILYNMERGRYAQVVGNADVSMADFKEAIDTIGENDQKALVTASGIGAQVAATMVNDNAIPYEGEGYERVLLHQYQALNYLKKNDVSGAGVEARRAGFEQNESLKRFEKEIDKAQAEAEKKNVTGNVSTVERTYAQMDEVAGKVKNSFQNAATFYLSGFIYELQHQPNDAYIDYKKALEIYPENSYLQKDVLRLAARLDMAEDLRDLKQRFPPGTDQVAEPKEGDSGELLVIFEDGLVPQKQETKIALLLGRAGLVTVAFPVYNERWSDQSPLRILDGTTSLGSTEPICDVRALAVRALRDKALVIGTRQIVRVVAKSVAAYQVRKQAGDLGYLATMAWNYLSENADLRSWLTLPANVQILRITLPVGNYRLALQHPMAAGDRFADISIKRGGKALVQVVRSGRQLHSSVMQF